MANSTSTEVKPSESTEPKVFLSSLENWSVDDEHLVYHFAGVLHPEAQIIKVECTPSMDQVSIDFARKALIADISRMRASVIAEQFICEVYAKVGSYVSCGVLIVYLGEEKTSSGVQAWPTNELMNRGKINDTLSDVVRSSAHQTQDKPPIGIDLGTLFSGLAIVEKITILEGVSHL
jgi:hypothetical protein